MGVSTVRYNPALDGVRAVAIILVLACHTVAFVLPGGWIGVDVFFVLSGYLITSILLRELRETGGVNLGHFYARRALRLLPPLALLALFQLLRSLFAPNGAEIREATLVGVIYLENWNTVFQWSPFDVMGHTWSLAVEEQFYVAWPILLVLIAPRRPLIWVCLAACAMIATRVVCGRFGYTETTLDYSMAIRPVGLLIGCALAMVNWGAPGWVAPWALAAIVSVAVFVSRSETLFLVAPVVVSLATAALIMSSHGASWLAFAPLRYIGRISYGLYLYHWPLFILGERWKVHTPFHLYAVGLIAVIFAVATISYEIVEKPILRLKGRFAGPTAVGITAELGLAARS
jgi:peptidoglycan/LPS O-acetylase OafA/YrhL